MKPNLIEIIEQKARKKPVKIIVCEGWDERCLQASAAVLKEKLAKVVLFGDKKRIQDAAKKAGADIRKAEIEEGSTSLKKELAEKLVELRKHKGMTPDEAKKLVENESYFGCLYAACGYADAVAGSAICPTAELMRPALQLLREEGKLVSETGVFHDKKNDRFIFVSDPSLNIEPTSEELASITLNAAEAVRSFDLTPKIALLSFSTKGSGGNGPQVEIIRKAIEIVKKKDPRLLVDGEMQVDAAVNPTAAKRKCPDSPLKGEANTLIFPNLTAANICTHALMQFSEARMTFSLLSGLERPVAILGRSMPMESIRNMLVALAMEVNSKK